MYGTQEVCAKLKVAEFRIAYLIRTRKLKSEEIKMIGGSRLYTEAQVKEISRLLGGRE